MKVKRIFVIVKQAIESRLNALSYMLLSIALYSFQRAPLLRKGDRFTKR